MFFGVGGDEDWGYLLLSWSIGMRGICFEPVLAKDEQKQQLFINIDFE